MSVVAFVCFRQKFGNSKLSGYILGLFVPQISAGIFYWDKVKLKSQEYPRSNIEKDFICLMFCHMNSGLGYLNKILILFVPYLF